MILTISFGESSLGIEDFAKIRDGDGDAVDIEMGFLRHVFLEDRGQVEHFR